MYFYRRTARAVNGVARFTDLAINVAQPSYRLLYSAPRLGAAQGASFAVTVGPPAQLRLAGPASPALLAAAGGTAFRAQPIVAVVDAGGNALAGYTPDPPEYVTASLGAVLSSLEPALPSAALAGRAKVRVVRGFAAFTDLAIDRAGEIAVRPPGPGNRNRAIPPRGAEFRPPREGWATVVWLGVTTPDSRSKTLSLHAGLANPGPL
jgi:hypothetical protein